MQPSEEQRQTLVAEVNNLFLTGHGTILDYHQLRRYVRARPVTAPSMPALPADEADEQLQIARILLAWQRRDEPHADLPAILLAACVTAPLHRLQWAEKEVVQVDGPCGIYSFMNAVTSVVRTCRFLF